MPTIQKLVNDILILDGKYETKGNDARKGASNLPNNTSFNIDRLIELKNDLIILDREWSRVSYIPGFLVNVFYTRVIPKSNRINYLFRTPGETTSETIVGARFEEGKHVITHYFSNRKVLSNTINELEECYRFAKKVFGEEIRSSIFNIEKGKEHSIVYPEGCKTKYRSIIVEAFNILKFEIPRAVKKEYQSNKSIITFYKILNLSLSDIFKKIGLNEKSDFYFRILSEDDGGVAQLDERGLEYVYSEIPYLICNANKDLMDVPYESLQDSEGSIRTLPNPDDKIPTIGLLDTGFLPGSYFDGWVSYDGEYLKDYDPKSVKDEHGTKIDSILVDGDFINKDKYCDGCGNFKVKHFGIIKKFGEPSTTVMERVASIVRKHPSIHVWNLSIGSDMEIDKNFISYEASILDKLQYENKNIVFVVSGTNLPNGKEEHNYRIGAPADSLNSIVVNSVSSNREIASYSRKGPVLSFFNKPDVCAFGGDNKNGVAVCTSLGQSFACGTSFAAPWIARKLSFLIDKMGLHREEAKALLIDSAIGWKRGSNLDNKDFLGYGIVPEKIDEIVKTDSDEIRFILSDISSSYTTYNYSIPIPLSEDKYPYIARATLCYFPSCTRNQGVDYTDTELSIKFGRMTDNEKIKDINNNSQDDKEARTTEDEARTYQRKWDNVKVISSVPKEHNKPLKSYSNKMWGMSITSKQRVSKTIPSIRFGVVITIKDIDGRNRIDNFVENCILKGWNVTRLKVQERIDLMLKIKDDLKLE